MGVIRQMDKVLAVREEYRAQQWAMIIQECQESGLSKRQFCEQRGLSEKSFYYWQRKLRSKIIEVANPQLVALDPPEIANEYLEVRIRGAELKLPLGVDMNAVAAVLRSIQSL